MPIRLARHPIGKTRNPAGMRGGTASRKARDGQVEAPQKKWTGLALPMTRARKILKTRSAWTSARQNRFTYSAWSQRWVSSSANGIGSTSSDGFREMRTSMSRPPQRLHHQTVKNGDALWTKWNLFATTVAGSKLESMCCEIELQLERPSSVRNRRRGQPSRRDVRVVCQE